MKINIRTETIKNIGVEKTIAVVSDFEALFGSETEFVMDKINEQDPDIVLFLGDYNFLLIPIFKSLKCKEKYAILGNGDYGVSSILEVFHLSKPNIDKSNSIEKSLHECGFKVLINNSKIIKELKITGHSQYDKRQTLVGFDKFNFEILLNHKPVHVLGTLRDSILLISGHTHGYEKLPLIGWLLKKHLKIKSTPNYFITSGVGGIRFEKSEILMLELQK